MQQMRFKIISINVKKKPFENVLNRKHCRTWVSNLRHVHYGFIHSFYSLSFVRHTVSSKASSPQIAMQWFHFQFTISSSFLNTIKYLLTSSSSSIRHLNLSIYLSFNNVFQKAVPTQYVANPVCLPFFHYLREIMYIV